MVETAVVAEPSVPPGNRVLILEADVQFATEVAQLARGLGIAAVIAGNQDEFERQYQTFQPSMLSLDVVLGRQDVFATIEFLGHRRATEPLFLVSGYDRRLVDAVASAAMDFGLLVADRIPKGPEALRRLGRQFKAYSLEAE
jgi:ActR/RegA family two-component response regulator